jgi:hypothetical protein
MDQPSATRSNAVTVLAEAADPYAGPFTTTYRVWHIPQIPGTPFTVDASDLDAARLLLDTLARYDQFQLDQRIKPDYSNMGGILVWNSDEQNYEDLDDDE